MIELVWFDPDNPDRRLATFVRARDVAVDPAEPDSWHLHRAQGLERDEVHAVIDMLDGDLPVTGVEAVNAIMNYIVLEQRGRR